MPKNVTKYQKIKNIKNVKITCTQEFDRILPNPEVVQTERTYRFEIEGNSFTLSLSVWAFTDAFRLNHVNQFVYLISLAPFDTFMVL